MSCEQLLFIAVHVHVLVHLLLLIRHYVDGQHITSLHAPVHVVISFGYMQAQAALPAHARATG